MSSVRARVDATFESGATASMYFDFSGLSLHQLIGDEVKQVAWNDEMDGGTGWHDGPGILEAKSATDFTGIETATRAKDALSTVAKRREELSRTRGEVGATLSRLSVALNKMRNFGEVCASAEARISDVDIAQEAAELTRNQILQQLGTSILAQANQAPQIAISLLS